MLKMKIRRITVQNHEKAGDPMWKKNDGNKKA
jgi:hypothetical protein